MKNKLPSYIKSILSALNAQGFEAYVVGGAVRDLLLGVEPGDFDVTTSAHPQQVLEICHAQNWRTVDNLGNNFGCVINIIKLVIYVIYFDILFISKNRYTKKTKK